MAKSPNETQFQVEREVRFAVVIYGGVSLAIYINGVVQEMLHMVRATCERIPDADLTASERVYRKLAGSVGRPESIEMEHLRREPGKVGLKPHTVSEAQAEQGPPVVYTRFLVDILSGTSAGGINAIYLAKALANGVGIDSLAKMWVTDAEMSKLLNDRKVKPRFLRQEPPPSLLNSRWMYLKLLEALQKMNREGVGSLVEDLDLYCTTTDLDGLPVKLALTDEKVQERRYRSFYWFQQRGRHFTDPSCADANAPEVRCDFTCEMDPFLAFAARCTSSFPVAFEPMLLDDVAEVLSGDRSRFKEYFHPRGKNGGPDAEFLGESVSRLKGAEKFAEICKMYDSDDACNQMPFSQRPFADGGYLDNKPFTHAIRTIRRRHATLPVSRKLVYIEPEPESFAANCQRHSKSGSDVPRPNALENLLDALVVLPRYETIRQDIDRVIEWNANVARLQRLVDDVTENIRTFALRSETSEAGLGPLAYESYWRTRLSDTADQVAHRICEAMHTSTESAEGQAVRAVVGSWRDMRFEPPQRAASDRTEETRFRQQRFFDLFDFNFVERALRHLRSQLQMPKVRNTELLQRLGVLTARFQGMANARLPVRLEPYMYQAWLQYLNFVVDPRAAAEELKKSAGKVESTALMLSATDAGRDARVRWLFGQPDTGPTSFPAIIHQVERILVMSGLEGEYAMNVPDAPPLEMLEGRITRLQALLSDIKEQLFTSITTGELDGWIYFQIHDSLLFPLIFGTPLGEFEPVDIFRISPSDALPIQGLEEDDSPGGVRPLRGSEFGAFGGFLDQSWRLSDMLRGRLDGADRLITSILPDSDSETIEARKAFIKEAQEAIASDWEIFERSLNLDTPAGHRHKVKGGH